MNNKCPLYSLFLLSICLTACNNIGLLTQPTPTSTHIPNTPTPSPTSSSTFTITPTITITPTSTQTYTPTSTTTQTPTPTNTYVPLPAGWNFDKVAQSWTQYDGTILSEIVRKIYLEYYLEGKYPDMKLPEDTKYSVDFKSRMVNLCQHYEESIAAQEYGNTYYGIDSLEALQEYFLGGPYCYAIVDQDD